MSGLANKDGRILILGAGHAGGTAAALLRQQGWTGPVTLLGDEPVAPYQRPPLSKAWLKGEADADSLALRPESFYPEHQIELRLNERAERISRGAGGGEVQLGSGESLAYDRLILATGSRARRITLPGMDLEGVLELRTAADADRLKAALQPGARLAVVGGGYIGLEAAASARALGAEAVVIELQPRLLSRVAHEALATFVHDYHRARGVAFELAAGVDGLEGEGGRVCAVRLADGRRIACDAALIGVGAVPNQELAEAAGLACDAGVVVDLAARTSDPCIHAIGDCTRRPLPLYGCMGRLESVPNALEQAKQAAADLCGTKPPTPETPWFWSDQFDLKLQIAGLPLDAVRTVVRGEPATARFAVFHLNAHDQVQAVEAINAAPEFMAGRQFIGSRRPVHPGMLRDISVSMKEVAA
ncbi:NAD(P)/FAD-dependent oxidoreductase [Caulobacter sp. S45]|uniref:NAD(P)/FAD-dependent oxidoreductase n=1 Tax=Caulobacter sp. S45 TaxID=1641861 RepID=UPI0020C64FE3|nr:FAD-dependent oxidoreductase [Caulobacter sp. S45]